ncbi:MAG: hypothetical protein NZ700_13825 [Gemmataceae bacterium]|nr:hypothetical protein [Gemmataceae bacterium]MDW8266872.1 hypothetical protein [Gemmataceae bacterium]
MIRNLYMTELRLADWPAAVVWYRDCLGLELERCDAEGQFALFRVGAGRVALKAGAPEPGSSLLVFQVDDLAAELRRLEAHGITPCGPVKTSPEGYTRAILVGPEGQRLALFAWSQKDHERQPR